MDTEDFETLVKHIPPGVSYTYSGGDTVIREENGIITEIPIEREQPSNADLKGE